MLTRPTDIALEIIEVTAYRIFQVARASIVAPPFVEVQPGSAELTELG